MAHFTTKGKGYRGGDDFPSFGSLDVTVSSPGTTVQQEAPASLQDEGGVLRSFLFWDTGRRITNKRTVRWTFNHPANWSEWNAVAWYGVLDPGIQGQPIAVVDAYWVQVGPIDPTPIDGPASTFVNAPGGAPVAWPWNGNDHQVRTEWGQESIHAKSNLQRGIGDPLLNFSSWTELVIGGDSAGYFDENDDDITAGSGVTGIANSTSLDLSLDRGTSALIMAGYVQPSGMVSPDIFNKLRELIAEVQIGKYVDQGDPSPEDIVRLKLISESLDIVRGQAETPGDAFEGLLGAAQKMSPTELKRTIAGTRAMLLRGQAALKSLESMAAKAGKAGR